MENMEVTDPEIQAYIEEIREVNFDDTINWMNEKGLWLAWWLFAVFALWLVTFGFTQAIWIDFMDTYVDFFLKFWAVAFCAITLHLFLSPTKKEISDVMNGTIELIREIESEKISLNQSFDSFLRLLSEDFDTPWINAVQIAEISKEIETGASQVKKMEILLMDFRKTFQTRRRAHSRYVLEILFGMLSRRYDGILSRFLESQKFWLSEKTKKIAKGIETFIDHHTEELKTLDAEMQNQAHSEAGIRNQWALELQKARLEAHIENLEKMRIRA